ncbi:F-box protein At1g31080-like [Nicotiana tabacum]|uniref:F-box protein At1g31080-like n=1 Tax=Nicotiana tabacum TaxID=4097 RepID=A0AC58RWZ7_TOBAC
METKLNSARKETSIPQEIIFEIFSRLPAKSLMRFKCVSKFCNSLLSESDIIMEQNSFCARGRFYTQLSKRKKKAPLLQIERFDELYDHAPVNPRLDCVNSLFCFWGLSVVHPATFNPSTRQHWVFTLGIDESWREIESIFPYITYSPGVCTSGIIYRLIYRYDSAIAAFDVKSEKFKLVTLWDAPSVAAKCTRKYTRSSSNKVIR